MAASPSSTWVEITLTGGAAAKAAFRARANRAARFAGPSPRVRSASAAARSTRAASAAIAGVHSVVSLPLQSQSRQRAAARARCTFRLVLYTLRLYLILYTLCRITLYR